MNLSLLMKFCISGAHWLIAFICISVRGTDFGTGCCETWLLRLACAFIYIFVFLNLNDGPSRWRIVAYYMLVLLENIGMVTVFLVLGNGVDLILIACLVVFAGFFLGESESILITYNAETFISCFNCYSWCVTLLKFLI